MRPPAPVRKHDQIGLSHQRVDLGIRVERQAPFDAIGDPEVIGESSIRGDRIERVACDHQARIGHVRAISGSARSRRSIPL